MMGNPPLMSFLVPQCCCGFTVFLLLLIYCFAIQNDTLTFKGFLILEIWLFVYCFMFLMYYTFNVFKYCVLLQNACTFLPGTSLFFVGFSTAFV